jgi:hypothetical protein
MSYVDIPNSKEAIRYISRLMNNKWNIQYKESWLNDEYIIHKRGDTYSPIGGVEIETCVDYYKLQEADGSIQNLDDINRGLLKNSFYSATVDGSIRCDPNSWGIEFVANPKYLYDVIDAPECMVYDYLKKTGSVDNITIGSDTKYLLTGLPTYCLLKSCGTHIHMSIQSMTKMEYPQFNVVMRYFWLQFYQPIFIAYYDKGMERWKNDYSLLSVPKPRGKYEMFNEYPSKESNYWHFEIRALGDVERDWQFFCEYVSLLMNMWVMAKEFYDKMPKTNKKIEIYEEQLENMNNGQIMEMFLLRRKFDDSTAGDYLSANESRVTIDTLYNTYYPDNISVKEILIRCIEQYDEAAMEKDFGNYVSKVTGTPMKLPRYSIRQTEVDFNPDDYEWGWDGDDFEVETSPDELSDSDYDDYSTEFDLKF